ncbi:MAG: thiamine-phosphate kinase [Rhodospirillaceae bacterium]
MPTPSLTPTPCLDARSSVFVPHLGEFERIARYLRPLAAACPGALELSDDAALLSVTAGHELVVTTDAMVAGIHFLADDPPDDIAAKLLRTNLSDLAAMGAAPLAYSLVLALPQELGDDWLAAFTTSLAADQERFGIVLVGGDSVATRGPITLAITALGQVPRGSALTRRVRGLADGQLVFVTGTIGDAALGLKIVLGELASDTPGADLLVSRLRRPWPRLELGMALRNLATAAIDVSDGLVADLGHICKISRCAACIESAHLPLSEPTRALIAARPELLATVLNGGDDYELVFTAPPDRVQAIADLAARLETTVTEIGRLERGSAGEVRVVDETGKPLTPLGRGWDHFAIKPENASRPAATSVISVI